MKRALGISLVLAAATGVAAEDPERMTIERLYTMPRLIGTAPSGFAWSSDSQRLAFLWNDEGYNFRDVWTVDVPGGEPVRATKMPHLEPKDTPSDSEGEIERLEQEVRIERDRGVSEVTWHPNGQHLIVIFRGDLYLVAPGGEPQEVRSPPEEESQAILERHVLLEDLEGLRLVGDEEITVLIEGQREVWMQLFVQVLEELDGLPRVEARRLVLPLRSNSPRADACRLGCKVVFLQDYHIGASHFRKMVGDGGTGDAAAYDDAICFLAHPVTFYSGGRVE